MQIKKNKMKYKILFNIKIISIKIAKYNCKQESLYDNLYI